MAWVVAAASCGSPTGAAGVRSARLDGAGALAATYEVATIRPSREEGGRPDVDLSADSFVARNLTLRALLEEAYGIRSNLIAKVPGPLGSARFDVQAKVVDPEAIGRVKDAERGAMLRQVLFERFHLEAHVETKVLPVYEMVVVRDGPKFKETPPAEAHGEDMDVWRRRIQARDTSMHSLADALSGVLDHNVLDRTGLKGSYDFTLRWTPDAAQDSEDDQPPGLFAAMEDELGLKLRPAKAPVDTLVVDHAEMPDEN